MSKLLSCEHKEEIPDGASFEPIVPEENEAFLWGNAGCGFALENLPAIPEDAEELSYKEICSKDQYKEEIKINNTWNREFCPST